MVERAVVTKLLLRELAQPLSISSLEDRKRLQKLVYLSQAAGVQLGYGFSWYLRGPYSASLAKDYYNMPQGDGQALALSPEISNTLDRVRKVVDEKPEHLALADWLEIVASIHYLERDSRLDKTTSEAKIAREKPQLVQYLNEARNTLEKHYPQAHQ